MYGWPAGSSPLCISRFHHPPEDQQGKHLDYFIYLYLLALFFSTCDTEILVS